MAYIGLRHPYYGAYNNGNYGTHAQLGKAIGITVTPTFAEGTLYANDEQAEYDTEFVEADVTLETSTLPVEAATVIFGHTHDTESGVVSYNKDDESAYVGIGIISKEKIDGVKMFSALFLPKVKFSEPAVNYTTKGNSITYGTPSISGKATVNEAGDWKKVKTCSTEAAARAWIEAQFTPTSAPPAGVGEQDQGEQE